jgi:hypothetical protein
MIPISSIRVRTGGGYPSILYNPGDGWSYLVYNPRTGDTAGLIRLGPNLDVQSKPLSDFRDTGPFAPDSLVQHNHEPYIVMGYFRRFMVLQHLESNRLVIVRKTLKSLHPYLII